MKKLTFWVMVLLLSSNLLAQSPFGMTWGEPKEALIGGISRDDDITIVQKLYVPKPLKNVRLYTGYANSKGLYAVTASFAYIYKDRDGYKGKNQFYSYIKLVEGLGYKRAQSEIISGNKSKILRNGFYECINRSGCNFYLWKGVDQEGDQALVSIEGFGFRGDSGYISIYFIKRGLTMKGLPFEQASN